MEFKELLLKAKANEKWATEKLAEMYRPLLAKSAIIYGAFDEDLHQELWMTFLVCLDKFCI